MKNSSGPNGSSLTPLLVAKGVSSGYHGHPIVHDFDLEVRPGEVVALLGPNGAGKTTALLTLAGEIRPLSGETRLGETRTNAPLHRRARNGLALVTEERSVFMELSVIENLRLGRCDIDRALDLFPELRPLQKRRAGFLSGGEQQMVTLARALARDPKVLLVDELSLGLAPMIVTRLLESLRKAADDRRVGVLLVEQHVKQALRFADRVLVMRSGRIVLEGAVDEIEGELEAAYLSGAGSPTEGGSTANDDPRQP